MADRYINSAYVDDHLGSNFRTAATATGLDLDIMIEGATAAVQVYMRNSGYTPPSTQDPADVEPAVKLAVLGAFIHQLFSVPENSVRLPEQFGSHPAVVLWNGILSGDVKLSADPDKAGAVGGWSWTDSSSTGSFPKKTTRTQMGGY